MCVYVLTTHQQEAPTRAAHTHTQNMNLNFLSHIHACIFLKSFITLLELFKKNYIVRKKKFYLFIFFLKTIITIIFIKKFFVFVYISFLVQHI